MEANETNSVETFDQNDKHCTDDNEGDNTLNLSAVPGTTKAKQPYETSTKATKVQIGTKKIFSYPDNLEKIKSTNMMHEKKQRSTSSAPYVKKDWKMYDSLKNRITKLEEAVTRLEGPKSVGIVNKIWV